MTRVADLKEMTRKVYCHSGDCRFIVLPRNFPSPPHDMLPIEQDLIISNDVLQWSK